VIPSGRAGCAFAMFFSTSSTSSTSPFRSHLRRLFRYTICVFFVCAFGSFPGGGRAPLPWRWRYCRYSCHAPNFPRTCFLFASVTSAIKVSPLSLIGGSFLEGPYRRVQLLSTLSSSDELSSSASLAFSADLLRERRRPLSRLFDRELRLLRSRLRLRLPLRSRLRLRFFFLRSLLRLNSDPRNMHEQRRAKV